MGYWSVNYRKNVHNLFKWRGRFSNYSRKDINLAFIHTHDDVKHPEHMRMCSYCESKNINFFLERYISRKIYNFIKKPPANAIDLKITKKYLFIVSFFCMKCSKCGFEYEMSGPSSEKERAARVYSSLSQHLDSIIYQDYKKEELEESNWELRDIKNWIVEKIPISSKDFEYTSSV